MCADHGSPRTDALVGFIVGVAGGLIGLGGAELRLPYLVGVLGLTPHRAVPINLAVSMFTVLAAIPTRPVVLSRIDLRPFLAETIAIALGAEIAACFGVGWLRRLSGLMLGRLIFVLLVGLGISMIAEAWIELASDGFFASGAPDPGHGCVRVRVHYSCDL